MSPKTIYLTVTKSTITKREWLQPIYKKCFINYVVNFTGFLCKFFSGSGVFLFSCTFCMVQKNVKTYNKYANPFFPIFMFFLEKFTMFT